MKASHVQAFIAVALKPVLGPPVPLALQRAWQELLITGAPRARGVALEPTTAGGRPAERHVPTTNGTPGTAPGAVLLLHGGAFVTGSPRTHRVLASHLAAAAAAPVVVPHYRRAPEHPWPAAVDDAVAAYDELARTGPVVVAGDSAGGALALLLARERRPAALALLSPVTDLTGATSAGYPGRDVLLRKSWVRFGREAFVGHADARGLSPLHGDLTGLPPLLVHVAEQERLRPEGELLVERVRAAGGEAELVHLRGLWHDAHVMAHLVPEAAQAAAQVGRWVRARLDETAASSSAT